MPLFQLFPLPSASKRRSKKFVFVFKFVSVALVIVESKIANKIACVFIYPPIIQKMTAFDKI